MAAQNSIINDVGTLLRLPTKVTSELSDKACLCIASAISEAKRQGEDQVTLNIGIGGLSVNLLDMQCKFIPNKALKTALNRPVRLTWHISCGNVHKQNLQVYPSASKPHHKYLQNAVDRIPYPYQSFP